MRAFANFTFTWMIVARFAVGSLSAQTPSPSDADFAEKARKLREAALRTLDPQVHVPTEVGLHQHGRYPWKMGIVTTVFWIGSAEGGKKGSAASAWDPKWLEHFGGFDDPAPKARHEFLPVGFVPHLNPFYCALPYNDLDHGVIKAEAKVVIPWFKEAFVQEGQSVCRDRWVAIRNAAGKICWAQWSDCGPFGVDHWQYVFGNEKPKPNANGGAGLNVSPAVRDYLGLAGTDVTDWKFVELNEVPAGPWTLHGGNNQILQQKRRIPDLQDGGREPSKETAPLAKKPAVE